MRRRSALRTHESFDSLKLEQQQKGGNRQGRAPSQGQLEQCDEKCNSSPPAPVFVNFIVIGELNESHRACPCRAHSVVTELPCLEGIE